MTVSRITIDCALIRDWESFHDEMTSVFGFPDFYGRNMDAWIDCMSTLDEVDGGLTAIRVKAGRVLVLELQSARACKERCPEVFDALVECAALVNWRRLEQDEPAVLALAYNTVEGAAPR